MVNQVPWNELDPEMIEPVRVLNEAGWETIACCSGHGKTCAWIRVKGTDPKPIAQTLKDANYNQFSISVTHSYPCIVKEGGALGEVQIDNPNIFLHIDWWHPNTLQNQGRLTQSGQSASLTRKKS